MLSSVTVPCKVSKILTSIKVGKPEPIYFSRTSTSTTLESESTASQKVEKDKQEQAINE